MPVTLPTKDTIPMYRVKSGELSQEIADKLYDYFSRMELILQQAQTGQSR